MQDLGIFFLDVELRMMRGGWNDNWVSRIATTFNHHWINVNFCWNCESKPVFFFVFAFFGIDNFILFHTSFFFLYVPYLFVKFVKSFFLEFRPQNICERQEKKREKLFIWLNECCRTNILTSFRVIACFVFSSFF